MATLAMTKLSGEGGDGYSSGNGVSRGLGLFWAQSALHRGCASFRELGLASSKLPVLLGEGKVCEPWLAGRFHQLSMCQVHNTALGTTLPETHLSSGLMLSMLTGSGFGRFWTDISLSSWRCSAFGNGASHALLGTAGLKYSAVLHVFNELHKR